MNSATNKVQARINLGGTPSGLAVTAHAIWVTVSAEGMDADTPLLASKLVRINF